MARVGACRKCRDTDLQNRRMLDRRRNRRSAGPRSEAARVLCRLAALHHSGEYRQAAVLAPDADYGRDAALTLTALEPSYRQHGVNGAIYGLALGEWLARP